jgi:hypothetical protein
LRGALGFFSTGFVSSVFDVSVLVSAASVFFFLKTLGFFSSFASFASFDSFASFAS